ncbi:hypothetical protein GQ53DRAFT_165104 [Thozetella sp. PMI_491]|nr:hypothetical protein GQ53DRAFT_165104 [Thozetella sp. PMI_491]
MACMAIDGNASPVRSLGRVSDLVFMHRLHLAAIYEAGRYKKALDRGGDALDISWHLTVSSQTCPYSVSPAAFYTLRLSNTHHSSAPRGSHPRALNPNHGDRRLAPGHNWHPVYRRHGARDRQAAEGDGVRRGHKLQGPKVKDGLPLKTYCDTS